MDSPLFRRSAHPDRLEPGERLLWDRALGVADGILSGEIKDITDGATFFRAASARSHWFDNAVRTGDLSPSSFESTGADENRQLFYVQPGKAERLR